MSNGYVGETPQTTELYSHTFIYCNNPECYIKPETLAETMEEAAEKWNTRRRKSNERKMEGKAAED